LHTLVAAQGDPIPSPTAPDLGKSDKAGSLVGEGMAPVDPSHSAMGH
jgi:hypothetical protein